MRRVHRLKNGLAVIVDPMPAISSAAVGLWVKAGARHEDDHEHGVAHLLEHMAFKGTKTRSARMIAETIEDVGGSLNADTSYERTGYYARVLGEHVPLAVEILADIVRNPVFDDGELAKEKDVVLQEIGETNDTPEERVFDYAQDVIWPAQSLGRPILGTSYSVKSHSAHTLRAFRAELYKPYRMVLAAAGRVDEDAIVAQAERLFGDIEAAIPPGDFTRQARYGGGERRVNKGGLEQSHLVLSFPGVSTQDPALYAARVYAEILGGGMSSRLFQTIREDRGLAYSVYAYLDAYSDGGCYGVYAGADGSRLKGLAPAVIDEMKHLADGPAEGELARAKAQLKASILMGFESPMRRADAAAGQFLAFGEVFAPDVLADRIDMVDAPAVRARAQSALEDAKLSVAALGPVRRLESYDRLERHRLA